MPQILVLDFDGVICDSLLEAYLITWRIAGKFDPQLAESQNKIPDLADIYNFRQEHLEHWRSFTKLTPLGNRAEDYLVIQLALHRNQRINDQREFDSFKETVDRQLQEAFHEEFYRERYSLATRDRKRWLALNELYPGVKEALYALAERFKLAVATSKDARTVSEILQSYGLIELFEPGTILDKSAGISKRAHLEALRNFFDCTWSEMTFVDDKVSHLIDCADLGARLYLAAWGYNRTQERELARKRGIPVLKLQDFPSLPFT